MVMASHVSHDTTVKFGFGSISGLEFRADIVKKGAALLAEGYMGDIKEITNTRSLVYRGWLIRDVFWD